MSFFLLPRTAPGESGAVVFSDVIEILESDDTVTLRRMNPDGGFYQTEEAVYDDDSNSLDLGNSDENGMSFVDALEDEIQFDDLIGDKSNIELLNRNRYVERSAWIDDKTIKMAYHYSILKSMMDSSMDLNDDGGLDHVTDFSQPANLDTSYSIGEIMQQQSITAFDTGSGAANTSVTGSQNISHAAEQSSRNVIIAALPKPTSAYVICTYKPLTRPFSNSRNVQCI
jgi:hypothetical protein